MSKIIKAEVIDGVLRTTYDDEYYNEITIPVGYTIQVRIVKDAQNRQTRHYKYAKCNTALKATDPFYVYSIKETTCKVCKANIKENASSY